MILMSLLCSSPFTNGLLNPGVIARPGVDMADPGVVAEAGVNTVNPGVVAAEVNDPSDVRVS